MPMFRSAYGGTYTVSGVPVVTNDLANTITSSITVLLIAALLVMAATLLLVFRSRLRLLPLAIALAAVGITFGVTSLFGGSLTMASIAVLPILIGLAVDYAVQFQARAEEAAGNTFEWSAAPDGGALAVPVAEATIAAAPTIATAALATAVGFLALLLSPVPMVRGFGELLIVGIAVALGCALTAGSAAMVLSRRRMVARAAAKPARGRFHRSAPSASSASSARPRAGRRRSWPTPARGSSAPLRFVRAAGRSRPRRGGPDACCWSACC